MSKPNRDDWTVYMDDEAYGKMVAGTRGSVCMWVALGSISFYLYDWDVSWGQVATFGCGMMAGYFSAISWVRNHAGRMSI